MPRNKGIAEAERNRRRQEAIACQKAYDELTPQQKLKRLDEAGWNATRQRARLQKQIEVQDG